MKHFKKTDGSIHAFDDDYAGGLITPDMTAVSEQELQELLAPSLADLKQAKNAEINAARLAANFTTFAHAGKIFSCDALSRSDIDGTNGIVTLTGQFPPNWPGGWKATDNSFVPIATRSAWEDFYLSMCATGAANFAHSQARKAALASATTPEQVAAIVW